MTKSKDRILAEDALDKLAEYLERMAVAIRTRGEPLLISSDYRDPKGY